MHYRKFICTFVVLALLACDEVDDPIDDNADPIAVISADATGERGVAVELDASGSSDPDADPLTFAWTFTTRPSGSGATITNATAEIASFVPDAIGSFTVQLTVSDGDADDAATTTIVIDVQTLGSISTDSVIPNTNSPAAEADYRIDQFDVANFSADVTIAPGVTIRMGESSSIDVQTGGSLHAVGTAALPIRIIGGQDVAGFWNNIDIESNNSLNELTHVEVANGGGNSFGAVYLTGRLTLTNSSIHDSGDFGLESTSAGLLPGFAANIFADNALASMFIPSQLLGSLDGASDYLGFGDGVVLVFGTDVSGTQTWPAINAPFQLEAFDLITVSGAVTVEPGALFVMGESSSIRVAAGGSFSVVGTASDTIRFVGGNDIAGHWDNIDIESNNSANRLSFVEIANGGGNSFGAVYVTGTVRIDNTLIRDSGDFGIEATSGALLPDFSSNHFSGNVLAPLTIPAALMGSLDAATVYGDANTVNRIDVFGTSTGSTQTWRKTDAPFFLEAFDLLTINSAITVDPGFRLLFGESSSLSVQVGGSISAIGTAADSIYFQGEQPVAGFWDNFNVYSVAANTMSHVRFGYGGGNSFGMIWIDGTLNLSNSHVHDSADFGVEVTSSGTYNATNVTYSNNALGNTN